MLLLIQPTGARCPRNPRHIAVITIAPMTLLIVLLAIFLTGMIFDFCYGLIQIWEQCQAKKQPRRYYPEDAIKLITLDDLDLMTA